MRDEQLLLMMAKQAEKDAELFAPLIKKYIERENLDWGQAAQRLQIEPGKLAELALCTLPRRETFDSDISRIADYVGVPQARFARLVHEDLGLVAVRKPLSAGRQQKGTVRPRITRFLDGISEALASAFQPRVLAGALSVVGLILIVLMTFSSPVQSEATIVVLDGQAVIDQKQTLFLMLKTQKEVALSKGDAAAVSQGDTIHVDANSNAQLKLADGSLVEISEDSTVELTQVTSAEGPHQTELSLLAGRISSQVEHLQGADDSFEVVANSSTAAVRGTTFDVEVVDSTTSYFAVDEGLVVVSMGEQAAELHAGEETEATVGQELKIRAQSPETSTLNLNDIEDRSQILVESTAFPGDTVDVLLNGELYTTVVANAEGKFSFWIDASSEGVYVLSARTTNERGHTSQEMILAEINTDFTPPSLVLLSPAEPPFAGSEVMITGRTEPDAALTVAGQLVPVGADGYFETRITAGADPIVIEAVDQSNNVTTLQIGVK